MTQLNQDDLNRFSRHILLPEVGEKGQERIKAAKVLIVGTGGLGAPIALYLAAAGIGTIGLVDFDKVELSNLQRQIIHTTKDIGRPKTASAKDKIKAINPNIIVKEHNFLLSSENALDLFAEYDIIVDGTDNFPARYLINDAAVLTKKPFIYGSILRFEGQVSVFDAEHGPCYRCLFAEPPPPGFVPSCSETGVVGTLPRMIGTMQANEVLKLVVGYGEPLYGRLILIDALKTKFTEVKISKNPDCPICGKHPSIDSLIDYEIFCGLVPENDDTIQEIDAEELNHLISSNPNDLEILDIREPYEFPEIQLPYSKKVSFSRLTRFKEKPNANKTTVIVCKEGAKVVLL